MAKWLARQTRNHKIVGSSPTSGPAKASWLIKNRPAWATPGDDWCFGSLSRKWVPGPGYLAIDRDGNCT